MKDMIGLSPLSLVDSTTLHAKWTESAHRIRKLVDDDHLLLDMLRVWLPPYSGADQVLYRGESIERWKSGSVGTGWTIQI
jgi:hypothetical protein